MEDPVHPVARLPEEWGDILAAAGERSFRAKQVFEWVHRRGVLDPADMTNLSKALRASLAADGLEAPLEALRGHRSRDGTRKLVLRLPDDATVETVLLPANAQTADDADVGAGDADDGDDEEDAPAPARAPGGRVAQVRVTQCISTQVGCAMGCVFCASGIAGLKRHMSAAEIVAQVLVGRTYLEENEALKNVVFMGMGEPLNNYDAVARAIRLLTHPDGIGLSPRKLTVSTVGLAPEIERLGRDFAGRVSLAFSLHNADDEKRSALAPVNKKYPLARVMKALRSYPMPPGRHITIEYTLVAGENDSPSDAAKVAKLLRGLRVKINLIPMNPIEHSTLGPPQHERALEFQRILNEAGYLCFIRRRRGDDVSAACGQLVLLGAKPRGKITRSS